MPYKSRDELPENVKSALHDIPHAQDIYQEAFNSAWKQYDEPEERRDNASQEEVAHRVAWSAVKKKYEKSPDGKWHLKRDRS
jgi:cation transport regulator